MKGTAVFLAMFAALSCGVSAQEQDDKDPGSTVVTTLTVEAPSTHATFPHGGTVLMMINTIGTAVAFKGNLVNLSLKDPDDVPMPAGANETITLTRDGGLKAGDEATLRIEVFPEP